MNIEDRSEPSRPRSFVSGLSPVIVVFLTPPRIDRQWDVHRWEDLGPKYEITDK
jgi:hypothetical protein